MDALADAFGEIGDWKAATAMREECVTHQMRLHGPLHPTTLRERIWFASVCFRVGDKDRGRADMDAIERDFGVLKARGEPLELDVLRRFLELGQNYIELKETEIQQLLDWVGSPAPDADEEISEPAARESAGTRSRHRRKSPAR